MRDLLNEGQRSCTDDDYSGIPKLFIGCVLLFGACGVVYCFAYGIPITWVMIWEWLMLLVGVTFTTVICPILAALAFGTFCYLLHGIAWLIRKSRSGRSGDAGKGESAKDDPAAQTDNVHY